MQLWYAPTSPFARKVRVAAIELGVALDLVAVDPWTSTELRRLNPLGRVPTLVLDHGAVLFESAVICEFLDGHAGNNTLYPAIGADRVPVLLRQALADGIAAAAGRLFATEHHEGDESGRLRPRFQDTIETGLDGLEERVDALFGRPVAIDHVAIGVSLAYLEFRWPDRDWRAARPRLAAWFDGFAERPSMGETAFHELEAIRDEGDDALARRFPFVSGDVAG